MKLQRMAVLLNAVSSKKHEFFYDEDFDRILYYFDSDKPEEGDDITIYYDKGYEFHVSGYYFHLQESNIINTDIELISTVLDWIEDTYPTIIIDECEMDEGDAYRVYYCADTDTFLAVRGDEILAFRSRKPISELAVDHKKEILAYTIGRITLHSEVYPRDIFLHGSFLERI